MKMPNNMTDEDQKAIDKLELIRKSGQITAVYLHDEDNQHVLKHAITAITERAKLISDSHRSFSLLEGLGVTKARAGTISGGIQVYAVRIDKEIKDLNYENKLLNKENTSLKELLKDLEWSKEKVDMDGELYDWICWKCERNEEEGHSKDCKLNQLLGGKK